MSSAVGDSVLDFDLNFLHPTPDNTVVNVTERRKSIYMVKKKTISADTLIRDFYAKKEALEQAEKELLSAKEECKQTCIQYKKSQDACAQLEKQLHLLTNNNQEWEAKYTTLENQYAAANSHVLQLQTLVKQQETTIESLKIENKLSKPNVKDTDKKTMQSLQKECDMLRKHICLAKNIVFGNMKLSAQHRLLLKKYDKYDNRNKYDSLFGEESNDEYTSDEIPLSPFSEDYVDEGDLSKINKLQNLNAKRKETNSLEQIRIPSNSLNECNDLVSIDTGRGSSRACSSSDKCFQSPDYFNDDNLICDDSVLDKIKVKLVDSTTSPIPGPVTIHVATSPINFDHPVIDRAVSPIIVLSTTQKNENVVKKCATNIIVPLSHKRKNIIESSNRTLECEKTRKEKECLELNNSENICNESSNDCEIETILSTMRLDSKMITPIPPTPAKPRLDNKTNVHRTPRKKHKHSENDNTAKYHKRPLNHYIEQNINGHTVKLEDRLLLVLNKDGSYVILNNQIPITLSSNNESSETCNKRVPGLANNDDIVKVGDHDGSVNVLSKNRNTTNLNNDIAVTVPDKPKRASKNNKVEETYRNDAPVAMDVDNLTIVTSCNNKSLVNNTTNESNDIHHPYESIAMQKVKPMMVTDNYESLNIDKNITLIETLSDKEIVMGENNETKSVGKNNVLFETVHIDGQTVKDNDPMAVENANDFIETESDESIIKDKDNGIIVLSNEVGTVTVSNKYRLIETLNDEPVVERHNKFIETPNTSEAMTIDNNKRFIESCKNNESTVTVEDNGHIVKSNAHKTMTVSKKYRLFEDLDDVAEKDDKIIISANNLITTDVRNNNRLFGDPSDDGSILNGKDDRTVVLPNHGATNIHISHGIFDSVNDDHVIMTDKNVETVLSPNHRETTIVCDSYELFGNLSEDDLSDKDGNTATGNKCDGIKTVGDDRQIPTVKDTKIIKKINNHGTTAIDSENALIDGQMIKDSNYGYPIKTSVNQTTSTNNYDDSNYGFVKTVDEDRIIPEKNIVAETHKGPMIMDKNKGPVITAINKGATTIDSNHCVAETLSDKGPMLIDKNNEIIRMPIQSGATTIDNSSCIAEILSQEDPIIMDNNNGKVSTATKQGTTYIDNNYCVSKTLIDKGPMISDRNSENIGSPIKQGNTANCNNYVAETLSDEGTMIVDKNHEHIRTPIEPGQTTKDNYYCAAECLSDEEPTITDKNNETIGSPIKQGNTAYCNNYSIAETISEKERILTDKDKKTIIIPNTHDHLANKTNDDVPIHENGSKNINQDETMRPKVCKFDEKKCKIKRQSPRSRRKSLFCVMDELSNDNMQNDFINTVSRIEEKISKLQSETRKSTENVTETDHLYCEVNTERVTNTETTAGGMSNDCLSASKTEEGKVVKTRKLTKLSKLKQKLLPKYKIKRESLPLKRSVKLTEIINPNKKMTVTEADSSATLNDKDAYEKAVQVVRELRHKKSISDNNNEVVQCTKTYEEKSRIGESERTENNESRESDCVLFGQSTPIQITTRSRRKFIEQSPINNSLSLASPVNSPSKGNVEKCVINKDLTSPDSKKQLKRKPEDTPSEIPNKRLLRNSTCDKYVEMEPTIVLRRVEDPVICTSGSNNGNGKSIGSAISNYSSKVQISPKNIGDTRRKSSQVVSTNIIEDQGTNGSQNISDNPKNSILCQMIQQYGVKTVNLKSKKVPDTMASSIAKKIEDNISRIIELSTDETKDAMNKFVGEILNWNVKHFLAGLMKYLKDPQRRIEMYSKVVAPSAPALTKAEQILLYVVSELKLRLHPVDIVDKILNCMEYTLFALNRTPPFEVIESISHIYAVICRYFKMKTRLRLFILDAMYCIQFKAVPLIRQCIEVWMHIIPLAHMASAKTPLVTCVVYLLHFYKCEDKLNRVQDIRTILQRKYFYNVTEWNEIKILELFRNSITSLRGIPTEIKMLRIALIILAKRQGPRWCQNNIVKNILQPVIEAKDSSEHVKAFCLSMLGPLLKPFPADMKVHCEIVMNQLITMLQENPPPKIAEGIVTSLVYLNKHNQHRVIQALILWRPQNVSQELEVIMKDFVKSKPLKNWKSTLTRLAQ